MQTVCRLCESKMLPRPLFEAAGTLQQGILLLLSFSSILWVGHIPAHRVALSFTEQCSTWKDPGLGVGDPEGFRPQCTWSGASKQVSGLCIHGAVLNLVGQDLGVCGAMLNTGCLGAKAVCQPSESEWKRTCNGRASPSQFSYGYFPVLRG